MSSDHHELDAIFQENASAEIPGDVERRLRGRLREFRERLECAPPTPRIADPKPFRGKRVLWLTACSLAFAILLALVLENVSQPQVWADVVNSVQKKPWIRCIGVSPDGTEMEFWYASGSSGQNKTLAVRFGNVEFASFVDFARREQFVYRKRDNKIQRRPVESAAELA